MIIRVFGLRGCGVVLGVWFLIAALNAAHGAVIDDADAAWALVGRNSDDLVQPIDGVRNYADARLRWGTGTPKFWRWVIMANRRYREAGIEFWHKYPGDERRLTWLLITVYTPPNFYWENIDDAAVALSEGKGHLARVNMTEKMAWDEQYKDLRAEFMSDARASEGMKRQLRLFELVRESQDCLDAAKRSESANPISLVKRTLDLAREQGGARDSLLMAVLTTALAAAREDYAMQGAVLNLISACDIPYLVDFARGRRQVISLRAAPFKATFSGMDGSPIRMEDLRGKVTLVDIWSNNCEACVIAMPKLQGLYDKYRPLGFEIVGVWLSLRPEVDIGRAREILSSTGATWRNGVLAGEARESFTKEYAIAGVPVTWLFDQSGNLVTNELKIDALEAQIRRLLKLEETGSPLPTASAVGHAVSPDDREAAFLAWNEIDLMYKQIPIRLNEIRDKLLYAAKNHALESRHITEFARYLARIDSDENALDELAAKIDLELESNRLSDKSWEGFAGARVQLMLRGNLVSKDKRAERMRALLDEIKVRAPGSWLNGKASLFYGKALLQSDPDEGIKFLTNLANCDVVLKREATEALQMHRLANDPIQLAFTAVDGRTVDLAAFRGKFVLLDFWATWCGPCVEEVPNVVRMWQRYKSYGFEVVGVSLDSDRDKLARFCAERGIGWPQYFDGKGWGNELALRFGVQGVPTAWLFDPNGRLIHANARGTELEKLLEKHLPKPD